MGWCQLSNIDDICIYIDAADVAEYCGRSIDTVRYWQRIGQLPPSAKFGRRRVWKRSDIEAHFESKFAA